MSVAIWIALASFLLSLYIFFEQRVAKKKSLNPVFEVKVSNLYGDHFSFLIKNRNTEPIGIYQVRYPENFKVDDPRVNPEEFGGVVLEDLNVEKPLMIEVFYHLRNGKNRRTEIELVRDGQRLFIKKQINKK